MRIALLGALCGLAACSASSIRVEVDRSACGSSCATRLDLYYLSADGACALDRVEVNGSGQHTFSGQKLVSGERALIAVRAFCPGNPCAACAGHVLVEAGESAVRLALAPSEGCVGAIAPCTPADAGPPEARADRGRPDGTPPPLISGATWDPIERTASLAKGSSGWPLAWADDGHLYTTYSSGSGFGGPYRCLGLARLEGMPPAKGTAWAEQVKGINLPSSTFDSACSSSNAPPADARYSGGILMVSGRLFVVARNVKPDPKAPTSPYERASSQLGWSDDHGLSWSWASWTFAELGMLSFIGFGQDYAGARDGHVYLVGHDSPKAWEEAPNGWVLLLRATKEKLTAQASYEYFAGLAGGVPLWTSSYAKRRPILERTRAYRVACSYDAPIGRYLLWMAEPSGTGFSLHEAPEPWGPWSEFLTLASWDLKAGDCEGHFPAKWMSADGKRLHAVFSAGDALRIRGLELELNP
jgi:hypothetical protein